MNTTASITIEVVLAEPTRCQKIEIAFKPGTSAREALQIAVEKGLELNALNIDAVSAPLGVYALKVSDDFVMSEGDRLEVYRPLQQDPMELRRQRAQQDAKKAKQRKASRQSSNG